MIFVVKIAPLMQMAQEKRDKRPARLTVTLDERYHSEVCQLAEKNDVSAAWWKALAVSRASLIT
jgi:hypothetical protein